eukprot:9480187-Pyramimonas_sp.AAC.1
MRTANAAFGGAPHGATKRASGALIRGRARHANAASGAFGGAPPGAAKRVKGVPCERSHKGLRWSSLCSCETCE